jgi:hypothetical protein
MASLVYGDISMKSAAVSHILLRSETDLDLSEKEPGRRVQAKTIIAIAAGPFESRFLQGRVCKPSVPLWRTTVF